MYLDSKEVSMTLDKPDSLKTAILKSSVVGIMRKVN